MISFGSLTVTGIPEKNVVDTIDGIRRRITLTAPVEGAFCEVTLTVRFPYPSAAYKLDVWTAGHGFPGNLCYACERRITYNESCHGTVLPVMTFMDHQAKKGVSIVVPPGTEPGGRFYFDLDDYFGSGAAVVFRNIGLRAGESQTVELLRVEHEDCYRPILKWMTEQYPAYFNPRCAGVWKDRGSFVMTNPGSSERLLEDASSRGAKWSEIHNHFPSYGNYAPQEESWESVIRHDYPELPGDTFSVDRINAHIARLHKHNIAGMLYIQCGGDAYIPWVEKNFPDAPARLPSGERLPSWKDCVIACDDGRSAYSLYVRDMIRRFLKNYPDIDGVFLDQFCYNTLDCAHSDGRCGAGGKPAAMTGTGYQYGISELLKGLGPDKRIWANGCYNLSAARYADGIMAEGTGVIGGALKYLCLKKPLLNHAYSERPETVEALMRNCLLTGGGWSWGGSSKESDPGELSPEVEKMFADYLPLVRPLQETEIYLGPDPVTFPSGYTGEIFCHKEDEKLLFVTLVGYSSLEKISVTLRGFTVVSAGYRTPGAEEWREAAVEENRICLPGKIQAFTVKVQRD